MTLSVELATDAELFTNITNRLLTRSMNNFSDLRGTCSDLEFIVNPSHEAEVTRLAVLIVPAVMQTLLHKEPFSLHYPRLADDRTGTLQQEVQGTVR